MSVQTQTLTTSAPAAPRASTSQLILVQVRMDHVAKYQRKALMTLVYRCTFPVTVGTTVLVPPTRLHAKWQRGVVVRVGVDPADYTSIRRIKPVSPLGRRRS